MEFIVSNSRRTTPRAEDQPTESSGSQKLPREPDCIPVHVWKIFNGGKVGVRKDTSQDFEALMTDMGAMYREYVQHNEILPALGDIQVGQLYVTCVDSVWSRVQLIGCSPNKDMVDVELVDNGDIITISSATVYPLVSKFAAAPHRGMICNLYGVGSFGSSAVIYNHALSFIGQTFDARVMSAVDPVTVVLYDQEIGADMNEWLLSQVAKDVPMDPLRPGGPADKGVCTVSYVSSACDVYLRRDIPLTALVDSMVSLVALRAEAGLLHPVTGLSPDGVYLGFNDKHGWCRMNPLGTVRSKHGFVPVVLMDYGDSDVVPCDSLRSLTDPSILARLPGQAVRVSLARVPPSPTSTFAPQAAKRLREIAPPDSSLIMCVVDNDRDGLPVVELFERLPSGKVAMVNATLALDESLFHSTEIAPPEAVNVPQEAEIDSTEGVVAPPEAVEASPEAAIDSTEGVVAPPEAVEASPEAAIDSTEGVAAPPETKNDSLPVLPEAVNEPVPAAVLPEIGRNDWQVKVCQSGTHERFYVQDASSVEKLTSLTEQMKKSSQLAARPASIEEGGYYLTFHPPSGEYRRIRVIKSFQSETISVPRHQVYHIDFGDTDMVSDENIRMLPREFRELPAQAIKAKIAEIPNLNVLWLEINMDVIEKKLNSGEMKCTVKNHLPGNRLALELGMHLHGYDRTLPEIRLYYKEECGFREYQV